MKLQWIIRNFLVAGLGLFCLLLPGCGGVGSEASKTHVAYEAVVPGSPAKIGQCIVNERNKGYVFNLDPLDGALYTMDEYHVRKVVPQQSTRTHLGPSGKIVQRHSLNREVRYPTVMILQEERPGYPSGYSKVIINTTYASLVGKFAGLEKYVEFLKACTQVDAARERYYKPDEKAYKPRPRKIDDALARENYERFRKEIAAGSLSSFSYLYQEYQVRELKQRNIDPSERMLENMLSGRLQRLAGEDVQAYYTQKAYHPGAERNLLVVEVVSPKPKHTNGRLPGLLWSAFKAHEDDLPDEGLILFCTDYAELESWLEDPVPTDRRNVILIHNNKIIDGAIVDQTHPFYRKCRKGRKI